MLLCRCLDQPGCALGGVLISNSCVAVLFVLCYFVEHESDPKSHDRNKCHSRPVQCWVTHQYGRGFLQWEVHISAVAVIPVCCKANRSVVSYRGHEWLSASMRNFLFDSLTCCDPKMGQCFSSLLPHGCIRQAQYVSKATAACDPKGHMFWDPSAIAKVSNLISLVALSASWSIIYGKKVPSNWCKLCAARVSA